ncbi:MAG: hypothetical protein JF586_14775 [Burkholderiales bacterium]|nr:hypothetical protein [Burkholderiales bacterium]
MTPQGHFMVVAEVRPGHEPALREVLDRLNSGPGQADPDNRLLPFARFDTLHFARFAILADSTHADLSVHGVEPEPMPTYLAFLGDCDGPGGRQLDEFVRAAPTGLREVFGHCVGCPADAAAMAAWLRARDLPVAAAYVNWIGRSRQRIREERALAEALAARLRQMPAAPPGQLQSVRQQLVDHVVDERRQGRLIVTADPPTPFGWWLGNLLHAIAIPVLGLVALPFLLLYAPIFLWQLRVRERSDAEIVPPPDPAHVAELATFEDRGVTNAFTAIGSVKPGAFRRNLVVLLVALLDYAARHVYGRGHLTRVQTIHFARWVFIDDRKRLLFASNYDGILESYMDDFINKVAWGLNLVFSNGVGYPRTHWLVQGGARDSQAFKNYLRRHQVANSVWYKADAGLSAMDLARHTRIRQGLERTSMSDREIQDWLRLM